MVGATLQVVAPARELFGLDLLADPALILKGPEPAISKAHGVTVHPDYPGVLEHGQVAPAYVARPRTVQGFGYLVQGERAAPGIEGIEDGASNLAQPLYAVPRLGLWQLPHLAGSGDEATAGRKPRPGPSETRGAQV